MQKMYVCIPSQVLVVDIHASIQQCFAVIQSATLHRYVEIFFQLLSFGKLLQENLPVSLLFFHLSSLPPRPFAGSSRPFTQSFTDIARPAAVGFIGKRFRKKRNEQNNPYRGYPPLEYTPVARSAGPESRRPLPIECCLAAPPGHGPAHSPARK